jgi:hypothetical protein
MRLPPLRRFRKAPVSENDQSLIDISFTVGDDGILTLEPVLPECNIPASVQNDTQECPPELVLSALELSLTPRKKLKFKECYDMKIDLPDPKFQTYRNLKTKVAELSDQIYFATLNITSVSPFVSVTDHPLVKAGLIPDDLVNVLVVPPIPTKSTKR